MFFRGGGFFGGIGGLPGRWLLSTSRNCSHSKERPRWKYAHNFWLNVMLSRLTTLALAGVCVLPFARRHCADFSKLVPLTPRSTPIQGGTVPPSSEFSKAQ